MANILGYMFATFAGAFLTAGLSILSKRGDGK